MVQVKDLSIASEEEAHRQADPDNPKEVGAPMPGKVFKLLVNAGDEVKEGDVLLTTEAMKMETNVKAPRSGVVSEVLFSEGAQVSPGDLLVVFE